MTILEIARKYVKRGWSVIPLEGKIPAIVWKDYQNRHPTDEELQQWFSDGKKNIGIVTGKISGLSVVDIDLKSGGLETLKTLGLPMTWTVKTGGGGWHYYYKYTPNIQQTTGIYAGIDIRNDGGQVVAPPSMHKSGKRYEWTYWEDEMLDFPVELFETKEIIKKDWTKIIGQGATEGSRNATAASVFGKLSGLFSPEQWENTMWPLGLAWNLKNSPPLPEKELRTVYEHIVAKAINNPREINLSEILTQNATPLELAKTVIEKNKEEKKFFSWGDKYMDKDFPLVEYGTYAVLFGQFSSGKTTFAMAMAKRNAQLGSRVCFVTLEMSKETLIKQYALKRAGVKAEQYVNKDFDENIFTEYAKELEGIEFVGIDSQCMKLEYSVEDIEEIIKLRSPEIMFIDNFNKILGRGTNEVGIDNLTSKKLMTLTRKYKVAIVVLHHANKPAKAKTKADETSVLKGIGGMRGTNKINDDADIVMEIGRPTEDQIGLHPLNFSQIAFYKDRDWDRRWTYRMAFKQGEFHLEDEEARSIALSLDGEVQKQILINGEKIEF